MDIKVMGTGCCASCRNTVALIEQVAKATGASVLVEKIEDLQEVLRYGLMSTPGVVIDGKVVHAGGIPSRDKIVQWLSNPATMATTPAGIGGAELIIAKT